jgi:small subunit ribosomal protein S8
MSMTDPIADFLTRIRNAMSAKHKKVDIPSSKIKREITQILFEKKFIKNYTLIDDGQQGLIRIYLKYDEDGMSIIGGLERVSKPGLRVYVGIDKIPRVMNNLGIAIMSTPLGMMTNFNAKKKNVGGEIICYVW